MSPSVSQCNFAQLVERDTGHVIVERLEFATTFSQRFWGWQFRAPPPAGEGLLIRPCNSIHTCWMRFPVDVIFVDRDGEVLAVKRNVLPWRATFPVWGATIAVEVPAGAASVLPGTSVDIVQIGLNCSS